MIFAIGAAVLGATTLWVLAPLFGWGDPAAERHDVAATERDDLLKTRQERLGAIKDLELEYRIGKLTKEDFEATRETLAREAVETLKQIDKHGR